MTAKKETPHEPLQPKVADKLLEMLSSDDDFRDLFQRDATAALAQVGHPPAQKLVASGRYSPNDSFACMATNQLASKDALSQARQQLVGTLTGSGSHTDPHRFDAGNVNIA